MAEQSASATKADPGVKLTLSVKQRFMFGNILPDEGNLLEMKIAKAIQRKVDFSVEELESINYKSVLDPDGRSTGRVTWDQTREVPFVLELSGIEIGFLKKVVNQLSSENKIGRDWLDIAIKIDEAKIDE